MTVMPGMQLIFQIHVELAAALELGRTPYGERRIIDILGGTVDGPRLKGRILRGGADWQIVRDDSVAELEARYTLRTDDGALIYVRNMAMRVASKEILDAMVQGKEVPPDSYYFRGATWFETSVEKYAWLTRHIVVCAAERAPGAVKLRFYKLL